MTRFFEQDVNDAANRLRRLAEIWRLRLAAIPAEELDRAEGDAYSPLELAFCAAGSVDYARAVGRWPRPRTNEAVGSLNAEMGDR